MENEFSSNPSVFLLLASCGSEVSFALRWRLEISVQIFIL